MHLCLALLLLLFPGLVQAADQPVPLGDSGLTVVLPERPIFLPAEAYDGFLSPDSGATIHGAVLPSSAIAMRDGLDAIMRQQNARIIDRRNFNFGGWPGEIIRVRQQGEIDVYLKNLAVFGDRSVMATVVVTFPAALERGFTDVFRSLAESARGLERYLSSDPTSVPYRHAIEPPFALAKEEDNRRIYTVDGVQQWQPGDPIFYTEARGFETGVTVEPERFQQVAEAIFRQTAGTEAHTVRVIENNRIDGLPAVQIVGSARDVNDYSRRLMVYQATIFLQHGYYLHRGMVSAPLGDNYLKPFVTMSESFERITPAMAADADAEGATDASSPGG